ncbi:dynein heavy chain, partial [Marasmius crinis-equi]
SKKSGRAWLYVQLEVRGAANAKLKSLVTAQQEAEFTSRPEPTVFEAQADVRNIEKYHLQRVRDMANPSEAANLTIESVRTLSGHKIIGGRCGVSCTRTTSSSLSSKADARYVKLVGRLLSGHRLKFCVKPFRGAIIDMTAELEAKIATYKPEYALLISETQAIKFETV